jgi:hypothetical protein
MYNNKNRMKDRPKSNAEKRKMYPKTGAKIGIEHGEKYTKTSKLSHNK